jgi:hypothetical protein
VVLTMAKSFTVRISEDLHKQLKQKCLRQDTTVQSKIIELVQKYVIDWELLIEHLQEMGKVCIDNIELSPSVLVEEFKKLGYKVEFIVSDRQYLKLIG